MTDRKNYEQNMIDCGEKTAVVILNWNGRDMMRRFLPSVTAHSPEGVVIVADNGSTDGSLEMLEREFPAVKRLALPQNYGFAEGYNQALAQISAPYFVLLNSDVETPAGWLAPLLAYMESHPDTAACQPKLLSESRRDHFEYAGASGGFLDRYGYPYCRGRVFDTVERDEGQYDTPCDVLWASGAALMVRAADWRESGGLDGRFFAHMEEIDLCWRLRCRGRRVACVPQSRVYHVGGGTLPAGNPRKTFLNFRNNLLMLYKNLPEEELRPVMRVRALLDAVAAAKFALTGSWAEAEAVWRARKAYRKMRPSLAADRTRNLSLSPSACRDVPERTGESLLMLYYIKGKKRFSEIAAGR